MAHTDSSSSNAGVLVHVQPPPPPKVINDGAQTQDPKPPPGNPSPVSSHRSETKVRNDDLCDSLCRLIFTQKFDQVSTFLMDNPDLDLNTPPLTTYPELPLHMGCRCGNEQVVERLLDAGADPDTFCGFGRNALQCTAFRRSLNIDKLSRLTRGKQDEVEKKRYINSTDRSQDQRAAVHYVVTNEVVEGAKVLHEAGADWTIKDRGGETPFELAFEHAPIRRDWTIASYLASIQWHAEYDKTGPNEYFRSCKWTWLDGQNTAYIQGYIWRTLNDPADERLRDGIIKHITPDFRLDRNSKDPVGGNGKESGCFFKKLDEVNFMSITFPYFSSAATGSIRGRKDWYQRVIREYENCGDSNFNYLGLQCASTLDEYCHPSLDEDTLAVRNEDQVLSRYQKELRRDQRIILTVPQLWVWRFRDNIITAIQEWRSGPDAELMLQTLISLDLHGKEICEPLDSQELQAVRIEDLMVGALISECVNELNSPSRLGLSDSVFGIFEKSIFMLSVRVREYTKSETLKKNDIDSEKDFILQIGDVREELSMIQSVLLEQEEVWRQFMKANFYSPCYWSGSPEDQFSIPWQAKGRLLDVMEILKRPQTQFAKFKRQIAKLDVDAERVEGFITLQLDLKSKHASLQEAHLTTLMSAAIIGFTIVTIIFTPLAFLASLFALSTDRFQNHQHNSTLASGAPFYHGSYIGKWMVTIEFGSLLTTSFAIWLALKLTTGFSIKETGEKIWDLTKQRLGISKAQRQLKKPQNVADAAETAEQPAAARQATVPSDGKHPLWKRLQRRTRQQHVESGKEH